MRLAQEAGLLSLSTSVFDYGCGKGGDLKILGNLGISCAGWDPIHRPDAECAHSDIVNLGYVVNVIEDSEERAAALRQAWSLAGRVLIVAARLDVEVKGLNHREFNDGCLTQRDTFQKFYAQHELREWINSLLNVESVAAAPGVFFVFRDEELRQTFASARYRRAVAAPHLRISDALFQEHRGILQKIIDFFATRGRLPGPSETDLGEINAVFGSARRAFAVVQRVTGSEQWEHIQEDRSQDLLVYLALAQFAGCPRYSSLPLNLQLDVKEFFGTYSRARERAEALLFSAGDTAGIDKACATTSCGKLTHDALYVHTACVPSLSPLLRVYEGCARNYVGIVEGANIIKMHRQKPKVSYLSYPEFDENPHPPLVGALVVPLNSFDVKYWDYSNSENPPILHRKEEFVSSDYPGRDKFARLTKQEERQALFDNSMRIGRRDEWRRVLENKGLVLHGHRLCRQQSARD